MLPRVWMWLTTYDRDCSGFPRPSTLLITGAAAAVLGFVALARGAISAGLLGVAIGVICIVWAEGWRRVPSDDD